VITTPTVLVLGAGASHPYGFPTGERLKREICAAFYAPDTAAAQLLYPPFSETAGFFEFREAFLKSGQPSIDAFLQHRRNFLNVGKLAIAYCLIPCESELHLYEMSDPARGGDWYQYLSEKLDAPFERFGENRLSIITFNYDRSLEHYLLNALENSHAQRREECARALARIPIIHVHGQLGRRPYPEDGCRQYSQHLQDYREASEAAAGITLLHEETSGSLEHARELLTAAERIAFLGFGYHPVNVKRLAIDTANIASKFIIGTTRGLLGKEVQDVQNRIHAAFGSLLSVPQYPDEDSLTLLRSTMFLG
jgi:hypothetical protein